MDGVGTVGTFINCHFRQNQLDGLRAYDHAIVHLKGKKTNVSLNGRHGLSAEYNAIINIHLSKLYLISTNNKSKDLNTTVHGQIIMLNEDGEGGGGGGEGGGGCGGVR